FDYACLDSGKIVVRTARPGETMNTLDGTARELTPDMLVIADAEKAVGIAGVMGGENSEIIEETKFVVFESANFNGVSVRKTASALGLRTDASSRFEKGLDIENTLPAVERACELVELLGAGEVCDGVIDIRAKSLSPVTLALAPEKINKLLGTDIDETFMTETLAKLGFTVDNAMITAPSWRGDIEHYSDLAEEVARFYGYDVIAPTIHGGLSAGAFTPKQRAERAAGRLCRALGFSEIYTYSFIGQTDYDKIGLAPDSPLRQSVRILNPLGEDRSLMRTTSLPSMLGALAGNWGHRNLSAKLYELATIYTDIGEQLPEERQILTLGAYGEGGFFDIKGVCEAILREMRIENPRFKAETDHPSYHPGRAAAVYSGDVKLGIVGQIHPTVAKNYGFPRDVFAIALDFTAMLNCLLDEITYTQIARFPAVTRDIAIVCDRSVTAAELTDCIWASGAKSKILREVRLFDVYTGDQVPPDKKSVAFSLNLRADDKTLVDEEADEVVKTVLAALAEQLGAAIR
ncbi:MAG: phenylalanine--tRNA ligase subunit beta, partial [Oscillospiraceae bacterium]|nr:phenylalanine--tRNA ligase subunit beta [Oscillospiraceae bacterium]